MEKEKIIQLLYNFYNQGYEDGYDVGYDGSYNGECLYNFNHLEFQNWCEENWNNIIDFSEMIYHDGSNMIHKFFKESQKKKENENIKKEGMKKYISNRYNESDGIEKIALELFLTVYPYEYKVKSLEEFIKNYSCLYELNNWGDYRDKIEKNISSVNIILKDNKIDVMGLMKEYSNIDTLNDIENICFDKAIKITMQEIVDEIKDIFGEEQWKKKS